jgi:hypothetical protein
MRKGRLVARKGRALVSCVSAGGVLRHRRNANRPN